MKYYEIDESAAKAAKDANSFSDYIPGSATTAYRVMVDEAASLAERQKQRVDSMYHDKIDALLDKYARRMADVINKQNAIDARVPSILLTGGSNFPVQKKAKQNAARERNEAEYAEVQGILKQIKSVGTGGIMSDDKDALAKLRVKLEGLECSQTKMKEVNAFFRKNHTLEGCPNLTPAELETYRAQGFECFPGWMLTNNNANIHRIRERIVTLEKEAQRAVENANAEPVAGDGYELVENTELGRIQFLFDDKPDDDTRALLKANGFRWSPSQSAWQRMLNDNGRYAAKKVVESMGTEIPQF